MPGYGTVATTRRPQNGRRAVLFVCSWILASVAAVGEEPSAESVSPGVEHSGCEQVPAARRVQCLKVMSCLAVNDDDVRRACIEAAQRPTTQTVQSQQEAEPAPPVQPARQRQETPPRSQQPEPVREAPVVRQAPVLHEKTIEPDEDQRGRPAVQADAPNALPEEPPDEITGTVSRIYQSILDRQLIAVDATYLFESDRAAHARLRAGERVEAVKMSSRFLAGRKWRITGPSRTPIVALRISCESENIRSDDRRKCTRMLDR